MAAKYSKWQYVTYLHKPTFPFQGPTKYTQIEIFGMKIYLATLQLHIPFLDRCKYFTNSR
jgi:hypothetical protein